jgi:RNA-directed DNA polymerase
VPLLRGKRYAVSAPLPGTLALFRSLKTAADVAALLGTSPNRLSYLLYSQGRASYRRFVLIKASGGVRNIASPPSTIARFQRTILSCLTAMSRPKTPVHGFVVGRSVASNAAAHVAKPLVLNLDLTDFFSSVNFGRVRGLFSNRPFNFPSSVATVLAQICCDNRSLPQGAPTSPIISNLICRGLDRDLEQMARKFRCRYTRYADDITFSTRATHFATALVASDVPGSNVELGAELLATITRHGFSPNTSKTRIHRASQRQEVTGLVVNEKVNVPRSFIRNIRAAIHDCKVNGIPAANARFQRLFDRKAACQPDASNRNSPSRKA